MKKKTLSHIIYPFKKSISGCLLDSPNIWGLKIVPILVLFVGKKKLQ